MTNTPSSAVVTWPISSSPRRTVTTTPYGAVVAATPVLLAVPILEPETPALVATCTAPGLSGGTELPPQKGPFGIGYHGTIQVNMLGAG